MPGLHRQSRHARRRLRTPGGACRRHRGVHPHQSGAALSRQRPARGGLCDRAHRRSRRRRAEDRSGRAAAQELHPAASAMPFKTALTFTYDSGEFEKSMDMALQARRRRRLREAARRGARSAASCAASASPTPSSAPPRRASRAPRSASTAPAPSRCSPAAITQGQGHETIFKQIVCDRLGIDPDRTSLHPGRHRPGVLRRRHRRLALGHAGRLGAAMSPPRRSIAKAQADRRAPAQGRCRRRQVRGRPLLQHQDQPDPDHQGGRAAAIDPAKLPQDMEAGLIATAIYYGRRARTSPTARTSARSRSTRRPASSRSCATAWSTTSAP